MKRRYILFCILGVILCLAAFHFLKMTPVKKVEGIVNKIENNEKVTGLSNADIQQIKDYLGYQKTLELETEDLPVRWNTLKSVREVTFSGNEEKKYVAVFLEFDEYNMREKITGHGVQGENRYDIVSSGDLMKIYSGHILFRLQKEGWNQYRIIDVQFEPISFQQKK